MVGVDEFSKQSQYLEVKMEGKKRVHECAAKSKREREREITSNNNNSTTHIQALVICLQYAVQYLYCFW